MNVTNMNVTEFKLERVKMPKTRMCAQATSPEKISDWARENLFKEIGTRESLWAIYIDNNHTVLGVYNVGVGAVAGCTYDTKLIALAGIKCLASLCLVIHNHPSGNLKPSPQDKKMMQKLDETLQMCDIKLLDSIIIGEYGHHSMKLD